jgi:hypothetical protein
MSSLLKVRPATSGATAASGSARKHRYFSGGGSQATSTHNMCPNCT